MIKSLLKYSCAMMLGVVAFAAQQAQAITLNFSEVDGAEIVFNGTNDTFIFSEAGSGWDFSITSTTGTGSAVGLFGAIEGTFTIGPITTTTVGGLPFETASVTSVDGKFKISDGASFLTADISWISIYTAGNSGGVNAGGSVNLTNVQYSGENADLQAFVANSSFGSGTLTFQFNPAESLTSLTSRDGEIGTSYSGSIASVPDGGATAVLLGCSFLGLAYVRSRTALVEA